MALSVNVIAKKSVSATPDAVEGHPLMASRREDPLVVDPMKVVHLIVVHLMVVHLVAGAILTRLVVEPMVRHRHVHEEHQPLSVSLIKIKTED